MKLYDLARMTVSGTPGTGSITLLAAATGGYLTFAQAQVPDGAKISYGIKDGNNLEVGRATYNSAGPSLTNRAPVLVTGGGQSPISLTSAALVSIVALAQDFAEEVPPLSQLLGDTIANVAEVESTHALRATLRSMSNPDPSFVVGHYAIGVWTSVSLGVAAALGAPNSLIGLFGMPMTAGLALVNKLQVQMATSAISGARNGNCRIDLRQYDNINPASGTTAIVQGFVETVAAGGNVIGAKNTLRTFQTFDPLMTVWAGPLATIANSTDSPILISSVQGGCGQAVGNNIPLTTMFDAFSGGSYCPLVLPHNYGLGLEATVPAAATSQTVDFAFNLVWDEYIPIVTIR